MSATHIRFNDDEDDEYQLSSSDEELTQEDQELIKKAYSRRDKPSDSEEEVFAVASNSDNESHYSDLAVSDVEGQEEKDDLPDVRAWGRDKRKYYATDYVDPDYGGFQGKDATLAELEEEEAKNLQKQLIQELDDDDFSLDIFAKKGAEDKKPNEEVVKTDVSKLSKRQKLEILQKESPEFFALIEDYKSKMGIAKEFLFPVITLARDSKIPDSCALDFVKLQCQYILNYCTNIHMYLLLKLSKVNVKNHPVAKRLYQYRKMLSQFEPIFEGTIKPQIEILLQENNSTQEEVSVVKKKTLKLLKKLEKRNIEQEISSDIEEDQRNGDVLQEEPPLKKSKLSIQENSESEDSGVGDQNNENSEVKDDEVGKRGITYQIAKNKGLTPHRKKEQRNPRVKHRKKFRKAKIRRKGAVREVRREITRYGGEISGIKASVSKSVKIK